MTNSRGRWAHVVELPGVAAIRARNEPHAVARWQQALALYRDLGEEQGRARCLRHRLGD